ncbi:MAG: hypothetical protein C1O27_002642 [Chloroflexi bacterium]|jgi:hypothetical protein|nr:MAG: hypothetical protein C1O27_002642 [Chloroflexota bacterium]
MALVAASAAAACGGDDKPSAPEYFQQLEAMFEDVSEGLAVLETQFPEAFQEPVPTANFLRATIALWREALTNKLRDLDTPAEIQEPHDRFLTAGTAFEDELVQFTDRIADLESMSEGEQLFATFQPRLDIAKALFESACQTLQTAADASGINVRLGGQDVGLDCGSQPKESSVPLETPAPLAIRRTPPPQLLIVGGQIQNSYGERVVLRGVAIDQPFLLANSPTLGHFAAEDYHVLADDWGANIIRVPVYPRSWTGDPLYMDKYLDPLVQWGGERSLISVPT